MSALPPFVSQDDRTFLTLGQRSTGRVRPFQALLRNRLSMLVFFVSFTIHFTFGLVMITVSS